MPDKEVSNGGWSMAAMVVIGLCVAFFKLEVPALLSNIFTDFMSEIGGASFGTIIFTTLSTLRSHFPLI